MPIDIYSTRAMLAAVEQMPREYSFLYDTFCADMGAVEDDKAIYDFKKGERRMAPMVHEGTGGVLMERGGYETREIGFCTIAPERMVAKTDIAGRMFGEQVMGAMTPEQRAKKMLAQDLSDMRRAIQRRREWMARQVLLTGKLEVFEYTNEGRNKVASKVADYQFTNNITPAVKWNESGADIAGNMERAFDKVYDGLGLVDIIVMDPEAAAAMIDDEKYMKKMDMINVNMGEINTRYRGQGVRFLGYNPDGVEMYSFAGKYTDDDNVVKPILPKGTVLVGGRGILKAPHGPVTEVVGSDEAAKYVTYIKKEVPMRLGHHGEDGIRTRITSRPTVVPFNVDAWAVMHVL